ncbi:MAG TPA: hypothetical protein DCQ98_13090 [Planctomycetaceae bacterium]|nr:hypothetical protein [Planctomycetaceae bacterium]
MVERLPLCGVFGNLPKTDCPPNRTSMVGGIGPSKGCREGPPGNRVGRCPRCRIGGGVRGNLLESPRSEIRYLGNRGVPVDQGPCRGFLGSLNSRNER